MTVSQLPEVELIGLVEALLFTATKPLSIVQIKQLITTEYSNDDNKHQPSTQQLQSVLAKLTDDYQTRGINLVCVAGGYRFQTSPQFKEQLLAIHAEKAAKITPAMMETLAIIAYKQPITRSEIEEIRGVAISSYIIKTLTERQWIKVTGHKEVPGRPAQFGTTKEFLAYFGLNSLKQLPEVMPINQLTDTVNAKETEA